MNLWTLFGCSCGCCNARDFGCSRSRRAGARQAISLKADAAERRLSVANRLPAILTDHRRVCLSITQPTNYLTQTNHCRSSRSTTSTGRQDRHNITMASLRTAGPSVSSIFRFASQPIATRRCTHCLKVQRCPFSSFRPARQASKRPLMTESLRPHTLGSEAPPPPKNDGTPETSISHGSTQNNWPPSAPWERKDSGKGLSEREGEAQKSKPTVAAQQQPQAETVAAPQPSPAKPKKSKLRPRKAPINLTPIAVTQLRALFESPEHKLIRIGVKNRGCSGLAYHLEYVDKAGAFDEAVEQDGVKVLIDSKALFSIIGSEMDWQEDKLSARFVFRNPNISESTSPNNTTMPRTNNETAEECGCGESFSIS